MNSNMNSLANYQSIKQVHAGRITEVRATGCMVEQADGTATFRLFAPNMTVRYQPVVGDFWVVYTDEDHYESISPRWAFETGYRLITS
jgi:lipocalin